MFVSKSESIKSSPVNWRHIVSGAGSGFCTRFLCQPFDVIKIRFQLQIEPIKKTSNISKYRSITQTLTHIVEEEGLTALWKGHVSAQMLSIIYGMIQFSSFEVYKKFLCHSFDLSSGNNSDNSGSTQTSSAYQPMIHFLSGGMSGMSATLVAQPFDVIRTRFVSQGEPKTYQSIIGAFKSIVTVEGYRALFRGLTPTILQIGPYSGTQFAVYHACNKLWLKSFNDNQLQSDLWRSVCCGAVSGLSAKLLVYPLDLIKKRLQVQGFQHARHKFGAFHSYSGIFNCITKVWRQEGLMSFYKGLLPSLLKASVTTALNFTFYEKILQYLNRYER